MKRWKNNVATWCMQAETSSVRHAMITLAESEAVEGNTSLSKDIWETILEDAKENEEWALVSHMLTHGNKVLEIPADKLEGQRYFEKEMSKHRAAITGGKNG